MECIYNIWFLYVFQNLITESIPSYKCHMNMDMSLNSHGGMGV